MPMQRLPIQQLIALQEPRRAAHKPLGHASLETTRNHL
jgi:hypothetical protein